MSRVSFKGIQIFKFVQNTGKWLYHFDVISQMLIVIVPLYQRFHLVNVQSKGNNITCRVTQIKFHYNLQTYTIIIIVDLYRALRAFNEVKRRSSLKFMIYEVTLNDNCDGKNTLIFWPFKYVTMKSE